MKHLCSLFSLSSLTVNNIFLFFTLLFETEGAGEEERKVLKFMCFFNSTLAHWMWGWVKLHSYPWFLLIIQLRGTGGRGELSESTSQPHSNMRWCWSSCDPRAGQPMTFKWGAGWWDSAEHPRGKSSQCKSGETPQNLAVTPDTLWSHKTPKQLFVIAMKKGHFLSRPESLLRCANYVNAMSLLLVRLHYCNWEQCWIHWLQWSSEDRILCCLLPGFCTSSKCWFNSCNGCWALCPKFLRKKKLWIWLPPNYFLQYDANYYKNSKNNHVSITTNFKVESSFSWETHDQRVLDPHPCSCPKANSIFLELFGKSLVVPKPFNLRRKGR